MRGSGTGAGGGAHPDSEAVVRLAIWGPYPTTVRETIGETVGVVRGEGFAMGIQALNPRTLGGYPWNENDAMPQLDIFESGDYSDLAEEGKRYVLYRVEAAKPDFFGSTLQAYVRNRSEARVIPNWGVDRYVAPPFDDGGVVGSAIALFGCPEGETLSVLGAIEVAEGLPHPTIDGIWGKEARSASAAYLILPFSESTLDEALDVTLQAGLRYLYHPEPFATWGHFRLGPDFPDGVEGLRRAVERAEARGRQRALRRRRADRGAGGQGAPGRKDRDQREQHAPFECPAQDARDRERDDPPVEPLAAATADVGDRRIDLRPGVVARHARHLGADPGPLHHRPVSGA